MFYTDPLFPIFILTLGAFVLLIFTTFSVPFISNLYFLEASIAGGVRFGGWGWCLTTDGVCLSPVSLAYAWDPQLIPGLTKTLVFYPIATGLAFLTLFMLIPHLFTPPLRTPLTHTHAFAYCALAAFVASLIAFVFMIALFAIAMQRFRADAFEARFGPLPWMSLAATLALLLVSVNSGCGTFVQCANAHNARRRDGWAQQGY